MSKIDIVCRVCGSEDVRRDAWATWDVELQDWILSDVFDYSYCPDCDGEVKLAEVPYVKET